MKRLIYTFALLFVALSAMAVNIPAGTKLYLKPNSNWKSDGARFAAYFFGNGETWVSMTDSDGDGIYSCTSPNKSYPNVIFCRMNPSASANNWNNKYNQTGDLTIPTNGNNLYTVKEGTWDKGGGSWSKLMSLSADKYMYFVKPNDWTTSIIQFFIGHDSYSIGYKMAEVSNTSLYYWASVQRDGYTQWAVFGNNSEWESKNESVSHRHQYSTNKTSSVGTSELSSTYNLIPNSGTTLTTGSSYTFLNKSHIVNVTTNGVGSIDGGSVSFSSYKLKNATTSEESSGTTTGASVNFDVVYTANVNLTAITNDGYIFAGWYDGETHLSGEETYSYQAENSGKTITAKFVEMSGNNVYLKPNSNWTSDNARFSVYFYKSANEFLWFDMTKSSHSDLYE